MEDLEKKMYLKSQLENYLKDRGINPRRKFRCLNPEHDDKHPSMGFDRKKFIKVRTGSRKEFFNLQKRKNKNKKQKTKRYYS